MGPDCVVGEILTLDREAIIPYFALLLDITLKNSIIPSVRERATVVPIYQGGQRSAVTNKRTVSLNSVVCQQMEHDTAGYLRLVWDTNKSLDEGQHGFRPGSSCERKTVTFCQDIADSLE